MAWYPGAERRPLGKQTEPRMRAHNILCFHTMVGSLEGTHAHFMDRGYYGTESHFGVGGPTDGAAKDGLVVQWQDTAYSADANLDGKPEVISIETSDGGNPDRPWSAKQLDALVEIGVWVCTTHNIPPKLIPDTKPGRRGIAYHRQGCDHSSSYRPAGWPYDAWRVPGGVKWSKERGKVCPGDVRIRQLVDEVIPRIAARINGGGAAPGSNPATRYREDDSMQLEPGNRTYGKAIPNGATHVVLNFPDGRAANVRIKWIGPKYPTTKGKFPGGDDYPDADWVTNDWTQSGVRRMRPMVIRIPQKGPGVEDTPVALRLSYDWDPESPSVAAVGSLDFRFS